MNVDRKPEHSEQCDDEYKQPTHSLLPAERLSPADTCRRACALTPQLDEHPDREGADDGERQSVAEREERREQAPSDRSAVDVADGRRVRPGRTDDPVRRDDGDVE